MSHVAEANPCYCRSEERRIAMVQANHIRPLHQGAVLPGNEKKSCTGDSLTDWYYAFEMVEKRGRVTRTFICGHYAAKHFLELTGHEPPPSFDPFLDPSPSPSGGVAGTAPGSAPPPCHPAWVQLRVAAGIATGLTDRPPGEGLRKVLVALARPTRYEPPASRVKSLNTILKNMRGGRPLSGIIAQLGAPGRKLRSYSFDHLHRILVTHYPSDAADSIYR